MKLVKIFKLIVVFYLSWFSSIAQDLAFGKWTFSTAKATLINTSVGVVEGLRTGAYAMHIGGVAFDKVAIPADSLHLSDLSFNYDPSQADGHRFSISINGQTAYSTIPDWELIPIAKYANSPITACFTLFGHLEDASQEAALRKEGAEFLNYHPELENTLLGLRLFQLDVLILDGYPTFDLPKRANRYLLGLGEKAPNMSAGKQGLTAFNSAMDKFDDSYQSYVICDTTRTIRFGIVNDSLRISGVPYVYFIKFASSNSERADHVRESIGASEARVMEGGQTQEEKNALVEKWLLKNIRKEMRKMDSLRYAFQYQAFMGRIKEYADPGSDIYVEFLEDALVQLISDQAAPVYLKNMSTSLSARPSLFRNINPAVWDAGVMTMRFSAFFRYCKTNYPDQWQKFLDSIGSVEVQPAVETPTVMKPNN